MWDLVYCEMLRTKIYEYKRTKEYLFEQIERHSDGYYIIEQIGLYRIPFKQLEYDAVVHKAWDIRALYTTLLIQYRKDFVEFYEKHKQGYNDALHFYMM